MLRLFDVLIIEHKKTPRDGECAGCSCEHELAGEGEVLEFALPVDGTDELADVPGVCLLEDALPCNAESRAQGIQTGFGGDGLPSTIHDGHVVVSDSGDQITVKVDG